MGYPMARHLLKAGHEVALWTHTASKAQELAKEGNGKVCATPQQVAQNADFIFYCVGNTDMARSVAASLWWAETTLPSHSMSPCAND